VVVVFFHRATDFAGAIDFWSSSELVSCYCHVTRAALQPKSLLC
jgi:hypothetical protein